MSSDSPYGPPTPPGPQPGGYQPMKKSNNKVWIILGAVFGAMILFCGGCFALVGLTADEADKALDEASESLESEAQAAPETESKTDEKTETAEEKPTWKTVAELEGNTNKAGPDFHLNGCDARMKYNVEGGDSVLVAFYVVESGTSLDEEGGFPVASPTEAGSGETVLRVGEGDFYIETVAANASWSVQVQEKC